MFLKIVRDDWSEDIISCDRVLAFPEPTNSRFSFRTESKTAGANPEFTSLAFYDLDPSVVYILNEVGAVIEIWTSARRAATMGLSGKQSPPHVAVHLMDPKMSRGPDSA